VTVMDSTPCPQAAPAAATAHPAAAKINRPQFMAVYIGILDGNAM